MVNDNIAKVKKRVFSACSKVNRDPSGIKIVAVSKGRPVADIGEAISCGLMDIGENKVQEAILKYNSLQPVTHNLRSIRWHMIGHLQTNKVKDAVKIFDLIHSVDSLRLAQIIDKEAAKINKVQEILLEIKTSPEESKTGIKPEEAEGAIKEISLLSNISFGGLMTIAPAVDNAQEARSYFRKLKDLREKINNMPLAISHMPYLSMGMTDDFEIAIEEGADIIRIGRGIFEGAENES
jgi:hypothetical protein